MHVRTSFVGTWDVFILPRQSDRGRSGKEDSVSDDVRNEEVGWVRLFFVEEFLPYSWLRDPLIFSYEQIEQNPPFHIRNVGKVRTLN